MREILIQTALMAGKDILDIRSSYDLNCRYKDDLSPVTVADAKAEERILSAIELHFPEIAIVAEERVAGGIIPSSCDSFFLIDPLDGTKEFIAGKQDFTVNIALIVNGEPIFGIVYAPALNVAWVGERGECQKLTIADDFSITSTETIRSRERPSNLVAVISRSHCNQATDDFITDNGLIDSISIGSSLKFCMLAEGLADVYPRFSPTMQWDTAAGDAVLRAAGGIVLTLDGQPMKYLLRDKSLAKLTNPDFIAWGRKE